MSSNTVNISFRKDLLEKIDQTAREESRSRSELIREAARMYIERKNKWKNIFNLGRDIASEKGISEDDVFKEIKNYRKSKRIST